MSSARPGRRSGLADGAALAGTAALTAAAPSAVAAGARPGQAAGARVSSVDPRYELLTTGINKRFVARPEYLKMIRSPGATGDRPGDQLVNPPARVWTSALDFPWEQLGHASFARLMKNFGAWHQRHGGPDDPYRHLSSLFNVNAKAFGRLSLFTQIDATIPDSRALLDAYLAELLDGTGIEPVPMERPSGELAAMPHPFRPTELPWLAAARMLGAPDPVGANPIARVGLKSACFRKNFTDRQIASLYRFLADPDLADPRHNRSDLPWHALFHKGNYRRLQRIERRWDPSDYFRHSLPVTTAP